MRNWVDGQTLEECTNLNLHDFIQLLILFQLRQIIIKWLNLENNVQIIFAFLYRLIFNEFCPWMEQLFEHSYS